MRKVNPCFLLAACWASCAAANDGAMSARILAATGNTNPDTPRVNSRTDANTTTQNLTAARTTRNRAVVSQKTEESKPATSNTIVRSGNRVVNIENPVVRGRVADTTTSAQNTVAARAARNRGASSTPKSAEQKLSDAVNRVGQSARTSESSINAKPAIRRAGLTLRPTVADVGGRAKIAGTDMYTGSNIDDEIRGVTTRAAAVIPTAESIAEAKDRLEKTAELNKSCQDQYNECMDQFCAVIDANQKRCSCSANLKDYAEVEAAVKDANNQLNDVAQRIRYIGLSADEIRAILTETEAEEVLSTTEDNTETRNMLEDIEALIIDPNSSVSYSGTNSSFGNLDLDLNFDFSGDSSDMFNLDFLNTGTTDLSSMRGRQLYNAAKKRCETVLNHCTDAGATTAQITGNYDLAIDKDCIAYETGLRKMNDTLKSNVRSANNMLQKARLSVLQNKNQYDAKACIGALETCMTDNMVCGEGYLKCLDPTKVYIDENGQVVFGQNIGKILDFMQSYNNANISREWLGAAYGMSAINPSTCSQDANTSNGNIGNSGSCVASYLLKKIGTKQKVTDEGLCRAVLDKCQAYSYNGDTYNPYNDVVVNYVQRAMVNIKAAQSKIISDYASSCMKDIATCYNQQSSQVNSWSTSASMDSIYRVMRGACRNVALTCGYAVFHGDTKLCPIETPQKRANEDKCIDNISEIFYQSLLCPDNSTYESGNAATSKNDTYKGFVNSRCRCNEGYVSYNGACITQCADGKYHTDSYTCSTDPACPTGATGTYPNCDCSNAPSGIGKEYNKEYNFCENVT